MGYPTTFFFFTGGLSESCPCVGSWVPLRRLGLTKRAAGIGQWFDFDINRSSPGSASDRDCSPCSKSSLLIASRSRVDYAVSAQVLLDEAQRDLPNKPCTVPETFFGD